MRLSEAERFRGRVFVGGWHSSVVDGLLPLLKDGPDFHRRKPNVAQVLACVFTDLKWISV